MYSAISTLLWCGVLVYLIKLANTHLDSYFGLKIAEQLDANQVEDLKAQIQELRTDINALKVDANMRG